LASHPVGQWQLGRGLREFKQSVTSDENKALEATPVPEPVHFEHVEREA